MRIETTVHTRLFYKPEPMNPLHMVPVESEWRVGLKVEAERKEAVDGSVQIREIMTHGLGGGVQRLVH